MTWKERLQNVKPELVSLSYIGGCEGCPGAFFDEAKGIRQDLEGCPGKHRASFDTCSKCWNSEIPETAEPKMIVPGRRNGKAYDMQRLIYSMLAAGDPVAVARKQYLDGLSAQVYAIDELHNVKNEERKPDMHPRSYYTFGNLAIAPTLPEIEDVIFNPPATIVFWKDKTKTVVKAHNEEYDPEKGLAMAMIKKLYGNKGNYCNKLKKWTDKYFGKYPDEKVDEKRANVSIAYDLLTTIRDNRKMTKSQMVCEIEDAIAYLGEALE